MKRLLLFCFLFAGFANKSLSQVDPRKLDSLKRAIQQQSGAIREAQESFRQHEESVYRKNTARQPVKPVPVPYDDKEPSRPDRRLIGMVAAIAILIALLATGWAKRKRSH